MIINKGIHKITNYYSYNKTFCDVASKNGKSITNSPLLDK